MQNIAELERRITAALERIGRGVETLKVHLPIPSDEPTAMLPESDFAALNELLDEERMLNAQLNERLRVVHQKDEAEKQRLVDQIASLTAEVAALTAARAAEADELAEVIAALNPLIEEASANA
jgi:septal ring factor EnvC (AmiA/AmiB activator)